MPSVLTPDQLIADIMNETASDMLSDMGNVNMSDMLSDVNIDFSASSSPSVQYGLPQQGGAQQGLLPEALLQQGPENLAPGAKNAHQTSRSQQTTSAQCRTHTVQPINRTGLLRPAESSDSLTARAATTYTKSKFTPDQHSLKKRKSSIKGGGLLGSGNSSNFDSFGRHSSSVLRASSVPDGTPTLQRASSILTSGDSPTGGESPAENTTGIAPDAITIPRMQQSPGCIPTTVPTIAMPTSPAPASSNEVSNLVTSDKTGSNEASKEIRNDETGSDDISKYEDISTYLQNIELDKQASSGFLCIHNPDDALMQNTYGADPYVVKKLCKKTYGLMHGGAPAFGATGFGFGPGGGSTLGFGSAQRASSAQDCDCSGSSSSDGEDFEPSGLEINTAANAGYLKRKDVLCQLNHRKSMGGVLGALTDAVKRRSRAKKTGTSSGGKRISRERDAHRGIISRGDRLHYSSNPSDRSNNVSDADNENSDRNSSVGSGGRTDSRGRKRDSSENTERKLRKNGEILERRNSLEKMREKGIHFQGDSDDEDDEDYNIRAKNTTGRHIWWGCDEICGGSSTYTVSGDENTSSATEDVSDDDWSTSSESDSNEESSCSEDEKRSKNSRCPSVGRSDDQDYYEQKLTVNTIRNEKINEKMDYMAVKTVAAAIPTVADAAIKPSPVEDGPAKPESTLGVSIALGTRRPISLQLKSIKEESILSNETSMTSWAKGVSVIAKETSSVNLMNQQVASPDQATTPYLVTSPPCYNNDGTDQPLRIVSPVIPNLDDILSPVPEDLVLKEPVDDPSPLVMPAAKNARSSDIDVGSSTTLEGLDSSSTRDDNSRLHYYATQNPMSTMRVMIPSSIDKTAHEPILKPAYERARKRSFESQSTIEGSAESSLAFKDISGGSRMHSLGESNAGSQKGNPKPESSLSPESFSHLGMKSESHLGSLLQIPLSTNRMMSDSNGSVTSSVLSTDRKNGKSGRNYKHHNRSKCSSAMSGSSNSCQENVSGGVYDIERRKRKKMKETMAAARKQAAGEKTAAESSAGEKAVAESAAGEKTAAESAAGEKTVAESAAGEKTVVPTTFQMNTLGRSASGNVFSIRDSKRMSSTVVESSTPTVLAQLAEKRKQRDRDEKLKEKESRRKEKEERRREKAERREKKKRRMERENRRKQGPDRSGGRGDNAVDRSDRPVGGDRRNGGGFGLGGLTLENLAALDSKNERKFRSKRLQNAQRAQKINPVRMADYSMQFHMENHIEKLLDFGSTSPDEENTNAGSARLIDKPVISLEHHVESKGYVESEKCVESENSSGLQGHMHASELLSSAFGNLEKPGYAQNGDVMHKSERTSELEEHAIDLPCTSSLQNSMFQRVSMQDCIGMQEPTRKRSVQSRDGSGRRSLSNLESPGIRRASYARESPCLVKEISNGRVDEKVRANWEANNHLRSSGNLGNTPGRGSAAVLPDISGRIHLKSRGRGSVRGMNPGSKRSANGTVNTPVVTTPLTTTPTSSSTCPPITSQPGTKNNLSPNMELNTFSRNPATCVLRLTPEHSANSEITGILQDRNPTNTLIATDVSTTLTTLKKTDVFGADKSYVIPVAKLRGGQSARYLEIPLKSTYHSDNRGSEYTSEVQAREQEIPILNDYTASMKRDRKSQAGLLAHQVSEIRVAIEKNTSSIASKNTSSIASKNTIDINWLMPSHSIHEIPSSEENDNGGNDNGGVVPHRDRSDYHSRYSKDNLSDQTDGTVSLEDDLEDHHDKDHYKVLQVLTLHEDQAGWESFLARHSFLDDERLIVDEHGSESGYGHHEPTMRITDMNNARRTTVLSRADTLLNRADTLLTRANTQERTVSRYKNMQTELEVEGNVDRNGILETSGNNKNSVRRRTIREEESNNRRIMHRRCKVAFIAGIVVGLIVVLTGISVMVWWFVSQPKRRFRKSKPGASTTSASVTSRTSASVVSTTSASVASRTSIASTPPSVRTPGARAGTPSVTDAKPKKTSEEFEKTKNTREIRKKLGRMETQKSRDESVSRTGTEKRFLAVRDVETVPDRRPKLQTIRAFD